METVRVILSIMEDGTCPTRENILKVCFKFNVKIIKVTERRNHLVAHCLNNIEAEKIFGDAAKRALELAGVEPRLPWALKSARTITVRKLDSEILNKTCEDLTQ